MASAVCVATFVCASMFSVAPQDPAAGTADRVRVGISPLSFTGRGEGAGAIAGVLEDALMDEETDAVLLERRCASESCRAAEAEAARVDYVLEPEVHGELNDYRMKLTLHDATGRRVGVVEFACEICTPSDAASRMAEQAGALRDRLGSSAGEAPPAEIEVLPRKAVSLRPVGPAVSDEPSHEGENTRVRKHRAMQIAGWSTAAVGVVGVVAGAALLVLDERPYRARCTGSGRDVNGECEFLYDTLPGGAASVAVGGAALVTGITLAVIGHRRWRASRLRASIGPRSVEMEVRF